MNESFRFLVIRPDRLGDVLLSVPAALQLKNSFPSSRLVFMCQEWVAPVIRMIPGIDEVMTYDPKGRHAGWAGLQRLTTEIQMRAFSHALFLYSRESQILRAVWWAGVPWRGGPSAGPASWFWLNNRLRQKRSKVEKHEAEYNLDLSQWLLQQLGAPGSAEVPRFELKWGEHDLEEAAAWLSSQGIPVKGPGRVLPGLWAVHPGMGGSAVNLPESGYVSLILQALESGGRVLVTAGPTEEGLLDRVKQAVQSEWKGDTQGRLAYYHPKRVAGAGLPFLAALFAHCERVVAPSTGPLHLAKGVGRPVMSFYPPIRVQSEKRWGPYPRAPDDVVETLDVVCPYPGQCRGKRCPHVLGRSKVKS